MAPPPPGPLDLLFLDYQTPRPYGARSLETDSIGGTEATTIRVARALARDLRVGVAQAARTHDEWDPDGVAWLALSSALGAAEALDPAAVVLVRRVEEAAAVARAFPRSRRFLWAHDLRRIRHLGRHRRALGGLGFTVVTVSRFLEGLARAALCGRWWQRPLDAWRPAPPPALCTVYNAVDDDLGPDATPVDPDRLLFLSAPAKGLAEVIHRFQGLRRHLPGLTLEIAHPGYIDFERYRRFDRRLLALPGQVVLGALPHPEIVRHLRRAFCVFYPQTTKAETFGLIYAEANAVGTPVLAHDFGAAREVLSHPDQLVDGRDDTAILARLRHWQSAGRPAVDCRPAFRTSAVAEAWRALLRPGPPAARTALGPSATGTASRPSARPPGSPSATGP